VRPRTVATAAVAAVLALAWAPGAQAALPLGPRSLEERRATMSVARGVTWTHYVRGRGSRLGTWRVDVLTIDRRGLEGRLAAVLSNGRVPGLERVSSMAHRSRAVAGVNGGYFTTSGPLDGDPVGAFGLDGRLVSEPAGGRSALLLPRSPTRLAEVARLKFAGEVGAGGAKRLLDGVDRIRGRIPGCGGRGGDRPTERPSVTLTCRDPSELVMLSPTFGTHTRAPAEGVEAVVRGSAVSTLRRGGGSAIPRDGYVLSGSGDAARFLSERMRAGTRPQLRLGLRAGRRLVDPADFAAIVGVGPGLLRAGRASGGWAAEGFPRSFTHARHPRTLAGVRSDGRILLVTVDGRRPAYSAGVTAPEAARVMRALGARDALNLDGGGSTTMTVRGRVVNRPSDAGGERPVADGLFVVP
jgi:Phosphodiester glycosidase